MCLEKMQPIMVERQGSRQGSGQELAAAAQFTSLWIWKQKKGRGNAHGPARALELICIVWALCIICIVQASQHALRCVALDTTLHCLLSIF